MSTAAVKYPRWRTGKDVEAKLAPQIALMECTYHHLLRAFGRPTMDVENNDVFADSTQIAWKVMFERGETVEISESRAFGTTHPVETTTKWRVNTLAPYTYEWIKEIIRDSNPGA